MRQLSYTTLKERKRTIENDKKPNFRHGGIQVTAKVVEEFAQTRWATATHMRHRAHIQACVQQNCEELIEPYTKFIEEVLSTPEENRDDLLAMEPLEPYEPLMSYPAYTAPTVEEQKLGFYSEAMGNKMR